MNIDDKQTEGAMLSSTTKLDVGREDADVQSAMPNDLTTLHADDEMADEVQNINTSSNDMPTTQNAGAVSTAQSSAPIATHKEHDAANAHTSTWVSEQHEQRSTQFTILKAIAIICVVLSHAGIRGWLFNFLFIFHVPVFFMCAGYFFHTKYLTDERTFVMHRIKGLYWPFLRWSVFFLVIHNLLFPLGILSEQYGNASGGVLHPYTWHQWGQHLWGIAFNMSGYNDFLCGTFWFFRALLLASLGFLILFKVLRRSEHFATNVQAGWGILAITLLLAFWKVTNNLTIPGVTQGGYRELMGAAFMAAGFLLRQYHVVERTNWKVATPCCVLLLLASFLFPSSMVWNGTVNDFFSLPLPAVAAFIALAWGCGYIDRYDNVAKRTLVYIGNRTLYIFAFHLVAFKLVSALKVAFYGLPWQAVGGHPTVLQPTSNVLWVLLYVVAGVGLPLLWLAAYRRIASKVTFTETQLIGALVVTGQRLCHYVVLTARFIAMAVVAACRNVWQGIKDIIEASSVADE